MGSISETTDQLRSQARKTSSVGKLGILGLGVDTAFNLSAGDNLGTSLMKAGVTGALVASSPVVFGAITGTQMLGEAGWGIAKYNYQQKQFWNREFATNNQVGGNYVDNQRAATMRQAAVQAIQGSKMNARSALGQEAKIMNPYDTRRY